MRRSKEVKIELSHEAGSSSIACSWLRVKKKKAIT